MSQTPTLSQPPEPLTATPSHVPPDPPSETPLAVREAMRRVRAELEPTTDRPRQARLLMAVADLEERAGDEPGAAREYLAAYNADQSVREPLEGLVRLLEKRRSLKNLGKLIDALVRTSTAPDERVRALLMRASYQTDVADDLVEGKRSALEATAVEGAPAAERASAWLALEVLAGRSGDPEVRETALAERTKHAAQPAWRALLLVDRARMAAAGGRRDAAVSLLEEARSLSSSTTWSATCFLEQITRESGGGQGGDDARAPDEAHANALDAAAALVEQATLDDARGDALGVPQWTRRPTRLVDAWLRAAEARRLLGHLDGAAATLDRALAYLGGVEADERRLAEAVVVGARMRVAEQMGDTALAARLAEGRLGAETDGELAAALAMRVAEHAASEGDAPRAFEALSRALGSDPGSLPARALQLDMLANGSDPAAFAAQLESFADHLSTDEARGRTFLLAAYVWAVQAKDVGGAKAALTQAGMYGVPPSTTARVARTLASISGDAVWYEDAIKRLLAARADAAHEAQEREVVSLYVELVRSRHTRGDAEGEARALREMAGTPKGGWLARVLEAFGTRPAPAPQAEGAEVAATPSPSGGWSLAAVEELAAHEKDPELARGLSVVAAMRSLAAGDTGAARQRLRDLAERDPSDAIVTSMLGDLDRTAGDHAAAAALAMTAAAAAGSDMELAATLELEAAFEHWRSGERRTAIEELELAADGAPVAAKMALGWAAHGVDVDSIDARRAAIERAAAAGSRDDRVLALERFATEIGGGDPDTATAALASIDAAPQGDIGVAGALARLVWSPGAANRFAARDASARIAARGPNATTFALAERARLARDEGDHEEVARAASQWFEAGGGLPAAVEWLAAAIALGETREDVQARLAVAKSLSGDSREAMVASATLVQLLAEPESPASWVTGQSAAVRLANLELSPPGCDPRRRVSALAELDGALGDEARDDALSLAGWSAFAAADVPAARAHFEKATATRPGDIASWEGLRACAELADDRSLRASSAAQLGALCRDSARGAAFWEEAALLWLELGDDQNADRALEASFARDPGRAVAFDKLFRRVRTRKDNDRLLELITRRLEVAEDPPEIQKLFWEQARVLREKGDQEGALQSLEHVTMLDPDHVGALALLGEINIRRGRFDDAATSLARLALLDTAPAKNRVTAGVAAVDLYENKLDRYDKALEVLLALHQAKLSTLPVRERLARAAARTGAWNEATAMLEELMNERTDAQGRAEAARLAMTIYRDRLRRPQGAAAAIVKLLEEVPADGEALDMLLQTQHAPAVRGRLLESARRSLVDALQKGPIDAASVRRVATLAQALSDDALHRAALGVLVSLGAADARSEQSVVKLARSQAPRIAMSAQTMRELLAPGDQGPVADLFVLLGSTLGEALGPTLQSCGVGRRDKVDPRSGLALRNEIASWAGAFGVREFDLYIGGSDPVGVQGVAGDPPSLVVGAGINAPIAPMPRARIARELLSLVRGTTVLRSRDDVTIAAIVVVACKLSGVPIQHPPYAVLGEVERGIGKAIARRTRKLLGEPCRAIVSAGVDARAWSRRALASQDRAGVVASGDPSVVLLDALGAAGVTGAEISGSARAQELFRYVLSPPYLEVRRLLGLEDGDEP
jgi:tetratricopeptide (TPR) repeat protein